MKYVIHGSVEIEVSEPFGAEEIQTATDIALGIKGKWAAIEKSAIIISEFVTGTANSHSGPTNRPKGLQHLTDRQAEICGHLAKGESNRQIAAHLGISEHTVRVHMTSILKGLDVQNRTQAAIIAARAVSD